jgi:hypothetical protein
MGAPYFSRFEFIDMLLCVSGGGLGSLKRLEETPKLHRVSSSRLCELIKAIKLE